VLDERRGRIEPVSGDYGDSALQYLSRSVINGSDTKAVRYEGQYPNGTEWTRTSTLTSTPILGCTRFLRRNSCRQFCGRVDVSESLPVTGDVLTFDDDTIATVLSSAAESTGA
jgi:hypothetical protein